MRNLRPILFATLPLLIAAAPATVPIRITEVEAALPAAPKLMPHEISAVRLVEESYSATDTDASLALLRRAAAMVPEPSLMRGRVVCVLGSKLMEEWSNSNKAPSQELIDRSDECYRLLPDNPLAKWMAGAVKVDTGQARLGGRLILSAIKAEPMLVGTMEVAGIQRTLRVIGYSGENQLVDEIRLALVDAGFAKDDPSTFGAMAYDAIIAHLQARDTARATALLPQILDVSTGLNLMMDRRFELIWPAIEEWSGGTFERQRDASVAAAKSLFSVDSTIENRKNYGNVLANAGQMEQAITLLKEAVDDPSSWDESRFDIIMLSVRYGYFLSSVGRPDDAVMTVGKMSKAIPVADYPMASNLMPNLAQLMIYDGQYQEAIALIDREYPKPDEIENDAAFGFYAALRFCAFTGLNKVREANQHSTLIDTKYGTNNGAKAIRDGCRASQADLRANWSRRMLDPMLRGSAILEYQRARFGSVTTGGLTKKLQVPLYDFLRTDPEIERQYNLYARDLPLTFIPALNLWAPAKISK
jgi:tetratricopeptide (TPR) repeat protein